MTTECNQDFFSFHPVNQREIRGKFDGGSISSDGGSLLLRDVEKRTGIIAQFGDCFRDYRKPEVVEHTVMELVGQRVYGLAVGYEDLNDHDELRRDPLLAVLVDKNDPCGEQRRRVEDQGMALAGKSTLNRMELGGKQKDERERYKKIILDDAAVDRLLVDIFLQAHPSAPGRDRARCGQHRYSAARGTGRSFFPWLFWAVLLSTAVHRVRRVCSVCPLATLQYRRSARLRCRTRANRRADPAAVAAGTNHRAWGFGFLPRGTAELVRAAHGRLCGGAATKCPSPAADRFGAGAGVGGV